MVSRLWFMCILITALLALLAASAWHPSAQKTDRAALAARNIVHPDGEGADYGTTFHTLEGRATAVTTRFGNATARAERSVDGDFRVRLQDVAGNDLARLTIHRQDAASADVEFTDGGRMIESAAAPDTIPTLNWANVQAYALWSDRAVEGGELQWRNHFVRTMAGGQNAAAQIREVRAEFAGDIVANTSDEWEPPRTVAAGPRPTFVTSISVQGVQVGQMAWYARDKLLAWNFPGLTSGTVNAARLQPVGGWNFTPTMAWANVQALAFYDFHTRLKFQGNVAGQRNNWLRRVSEFIVPALEAQNGCDNLHWLDNTVYRPCCDVHDMCYTTFGCSSSSWWWPWGSSWQCTGCNMFAAYCFQTGGCAFFPCWDVPNW